MVKRHLKGRENALNTDANIDFFRDLASAPRPMLLAASSATVAFPMVGSAFAAGVAFGFALASPPAGSSCANGHCSPRVHVPFG